MVLKVKGKFNREGGRIFQIEGTNTKVPRDTVHQGKRVSGGDGPRKAAALSRASYLTGLAGLGPL